MADQELDRNEAATPFKLQRAREQGQTPRSADFVSTVVFLTAMVYVAGQGMQTVQGLLQLAEQHPAVELEKAARVATHHGTWRLRDLKRLLELPGNVVQLDFLETHPLIRSLDAYRIEPAENLNPNQNS